VRDEVLTESKLCRLVLTTSQADQLRNIGRTLASDKRWWGDRDAADERDRTVIRCDRMSPTTYAITVYNAIGAIGLGNIQLIVQPKIPTPHLLHLLAESQQLPRASAERAQLDGDKAFFVLVVRWFLDASEELLRRGLCRDYESTTRDLSFARGRIHILSTTRSILAGRPLLRCSFDDFSEDTSLNRVLKAAARNVLASPGLPANLRRRGRCVYQRLDGAGEVRSSDLNTVPDARSRHYWDAHRLALVILTSGGVVPARGTQPAWTFLFRTPEAVEEGVRNALRRRLEPDWKVRKYGMRLGGTRNRSLSPDLVIGDGVAIGDVKYRVTASGDIDRSHLNQVTTFATGYGTGRAMLLAFGTPSRGEIVHVGPVQVHGFNWDTSETDPTRASAKLAQEISLWLGSKRSTEVAEQQSRALMKAQAMGHDVSGLDHLVAKFRLGPVASAELNTVETKPYGAASDRYMPHF
jgi:5-methylcytosine-specific restriction enzyme subunit McrC